MSYSPANILATYLDSLESSEWFYGINYEPDAPDDCVTVYDTGGVVEGKDASGRQYEHPGIQVRVRSANQESGYEKAKALAAVADAVLHTNVMMNDGSVEQIQATRRTSPVFSLGRQEGSQRFLFTFNLLLTLNGQISPATTTTTATP